MRRILTAVVGLPILWAIIKLSSPLVWCLLITVVTALASWELLSLLRAAGHRGCRWVGILGSVAVLVPFAVPKVDAALPMVATGATAIIVGAIRARDFADAVDGALCTVFSVAFVGLNLGYQIALRSMSYDAPAEGSSWCGLAPLEWRFGTSGGDALGQDLLVLLLFAVWSGDSAAYFFGSRFGRRPLAPRLSPKKTIEGALAGVLASALAGFVASQWFFRRLPPVHAVMLGMILGLAGIAGDLAESVVKRPAGAKDSAAILPGHGGVLDRVDSLLLAAPALFYYHHALLSSVL